MQTETSPIPRGKALNRVMAWMRALMFCPPLAMVVAPGKRRRPSSAMDSRTRP